MRLRTQRLDFADGTVATVVARRDAATGSYEVDSGGPLGFLTPGTSKLEQPARGAR